MAIKFRIIDGSQVELEGFEAQNEMLLKLRSNVNYYEEKLAEKLTAHNREIYAKCLIRCIERRDKFLELMKNDQIK